MTSVAGLPPILAFLKSGYWLSLWLPQIAMWLTSPTSTPAFLASCEAARFWSSRVMANQRSAGTLGACDLAIRALVLHGLATVRTRTSGPAASLIACPWLVKIGPLARIRSARVMPSLRGIPPMKMTQSAPSNATRASSDALTSARVGNAQSSSSMMVPVRAGRAGVISRRLSATGRSGPNTAPEASRKIVA